MAFNYNGVLPTEIKYNGTSINVLKYNETKVWGKPFTLSITQGNNTTVTVNRTSSPNQNANTGVLTSGSLVYYGDVLSISVSVNSGYDLQSFTVNAVTWTSGNSKTVTSSIIVVSSAVASASWKQVWSGYLTFSTTTYSDYVDLEKTVNGVVFGRPTRIYGKGFENNDSFNGINLSSNPSSTVLVVRDGTANLIDQYMYGVSSDNTLKGRVKAYRRTFPATTFERGFILQQVYQYY